MTLSLKPGTSWADVYARARAIAPEAFDADRILNLLGGEWRRTGVTGRARHAGRRLDDPGPAADRPRRRGHRGRPGRRRAQGVGRRRPRRAQEPGEGRRRRDARAPRDPGAAAGLGDRQALAAGVRRRRPRAGRGRLVPAGDRAPARGPHPAARPGQQHRLVELPDVGAGARRARAGARRQRRGRQDPVAGRLPHPHAGARDHAPSGPAGDAAVGRRLAPSATPSSAPRRSVRSPSSAAGPTGARRRPRWPTPASGTSWSRRASTPGASGTSASGTTSRRT